MHCASAQEKQWRAPLEWFVVSAILRRSMQRALLEHLPGRARIPCVVCHCAAHLGQCSAACFKMFC